MWQIQAEGAQALASALAASNSITVLDLVKNSIPAAGAEDTTPRKHSASLTCSIATIMHIGEQLSYFSESHYDVEGACRCPQDEFQPARAPSRNERHRRRWTVSKILMLDPTTDSDLVQGRSRECSGDEQLPHSPRGGCCPRDIFLLSRGLTGLSSGG